MRERETLAEAASEARSWFGGGLSPAVTLGDEVRAKLQKAVDAFHLLEEEQKNG